MSNLQPNPEKGRSPEEVVFASGVAIAAMGFLMAIAAIWTGDDRWDKTATVMFVLAALFIGSAEWRRRHPFNR